jgi:hypothetical protein
MFALGFCQGQERSLQLTFLRAFARGRLSELVGPQAISADHLAHRMDLAGWALAVFNALSPASRDIFEAFASGVRAGQSIGRRKRSPGHHLLRVHPQPFSALDAVALSCLRRMGASCGAIEGSSTRAWEAWLLGDFVCSEDAWWSDLALAVRTASLPSPYYFAHLDLKGATLAGATWVGCPLFAVGHDRQQAWRPVPMDLGHAGGERLGASTTVQLYPRGSSRRELRYRPHLRSSLDLGELTAELEAWIGLQSMVANSCRYSSVGLEFAEAGCSLQDGGVQKDTTRRSLGAIRPLSLEHPVSRLRPRMRAAFTLGPLAWRQGERPPCALSYRIDAGDPETGRLGYPGGQSGNPLSPHYDDLVPTWLRGGGIPIVVDDADVERLALHRLQVRGGGSV